MVLSETLLLLKTARLLIVTSIEENWEFETQHFCCDKVHFMYSRVAVMSFRETRPPPHHHSYHDGGPVLNTAHFYYIIGNHRVWISSLGTFKDPSAFAIRSSKAYKIKALTSDVPSTSCHFEMTCENLFLFHSSPESRCAKVLQSSA